MICRLSKALASFSAESEGFEPPELLHSTVFKTAAIDHSANSPPQKYKLNLILQTQKHLFYHLDRYSELTRTL